MASPIYECGRDNCPGTTGMSHRTEACPGRKTTAPTPTEEGVIDHCFFCKGKWGACTCEAVEGDGFAFDEFQITDPGVSVCGRFYVNPEIYYGDAYKRWAAKE